MTNEQFILALTVLAVTCTLITGITAVIAVFIILKNPERMNARTGIIISSIFCSVVILYLIIGGCLIWCRSKKSRDELVEIKEHIESGYEVYLDGELIDGTKIELSNYRVTLDEEKQKVYLIKK